MDKKGQIGFILTGIAILVIIGLVIGTLYLNKISNDKLQKANCANLAKNGYNTKLEIVDVLGPNLLDCYVEIELGKYVPYDRFRGFELD